MSEKCCYVFLLPKCLFRHYKSVYHTKLSSTHVYQSGRNHLIGMTWLRLFWIFFYENQCFLCLTHINSSNPIQFYFSIKEKREESFKSKTLLNCWSRKFSWAHIIDYVFSRIPEPSLLAILKYIGIYGQEHDLNYKRKYVTHFIRYLIKNWETECPFIHIHKGFDQCRTANTHNSPITAIYYSFL